MALTNPIPEIPDSRQVNAIGCQQASFLIIPGTSDYPTGGYVISGLQCRMPKGIISVSIDGINTTGNNLGYIWNAIVNYTLASNGIPIVPTSFNIYVANIVTNVVTQLNAGTNLTGAILSVTVQGY